MEEEFDFNTLDKDVIEPCRRLTNEGLTTTFSCDGVYSHHTEHLDQFDEVKYLGYITFTCKKEYQEKMFKFISNIYTKGGKLFFDINNLFVINDNTIDTFGIRFHNHNGDFSELLDNALIDTFDKSIIYDSNDYNFVTNILERANLKYKLNVALVYGKDPIGNYLVIRHNSWNENITKENKKIVLNEISSLYKNIISKYPMFEGKISNWKHSFLIRIDNHIEEALDIIKLIEINN